MTTQLDHPLTQAITAARQGLNVSGQPAARIAAYQAPCGTVKLTVTHVQLSKKLSRTARRVALKALARIIRSEIAAEAAELNPIRIKVR